MQSIQDLSMDSVKMREYSNASNLCNALLSFLPIKAVSLSLVKLIYAWNLQLLTLCKLCITWVSWFERFDLAYCSADSKLLASNSWQLACREYLAGGWWYLTASKSISVEIKYTDHAAVLFTLSENSTRCTEPLYSLWIQWNKRYRIHPWFVTVQHGYW